MTAEGVVIPLRSPRTTASETNPFPLWNDPEFYSVSKADSRAFGTGHLDLAVARLVVYGKPSAQVKDALAGLSPVYMAPFGGFSR
jgi:hypothetical protein